MKGMILGALAIAALSLTACGGKSCRDLCAHPCSGETVATCQAGCDKADGVNSASGCTDKFNTFVSCAGGLSDSDRCSTTNTTCDTDLNAWSSCVASYCSSHSTDANCM